MALSKSRLSQWLLPRHLSVRTFDGDGDYDEDAGELLPAPRLSVAAAQAVPVAALAGVLAREDVEAVAALAARLKRTRPDARQCNGGAWTTVYLSCGRAFQRELPVLASRLVHAAKRAAADQMGLDLRGVDLRVRCVEHHEMAAGGALADECHYDSGSVLTIDVMLAAPGDDFDGGALWFPGADGARAAGLARRGDAVVFASHRYHAVRPVEAGTRRVLIVELWEGPERGCPHRCQSATAPCVFDDVDAPAAAGPRKRFSWPPRRGAGRVHSAAE